MSHDITDNLVLTLAIGLVLLPLLIIVWRALMPDSDYFDDLTEDHHDRDRTGV
jgi:hypothetical protein